MDIEGAEVEVIEAASPIMETFKPKFTIASYHERKGKKSCELLEPLFHRAGYHTRTGFPQHLTTYASPDPISTMREPRHVFHRPRFLKRWGGRKQR